MNIRTQPQRTVTSDKSACDIDANPAVRKVIDWNKLLRSLSPKSMLPIVAGLSYSASITIKVPMAINANVIITTILVCSEKRLIIVLIPNCKD